MKISNFKKEKFKKGSLEENKIVLIFEFACEMNLYFNNKFE